MKATGEAQQDKPIYYCSEKEKKRKQEYLGTKEWLRREDMFQHYLQR